MLREPAEPSAAEPKQSGSFRYLQGMLEAGEGGKIPALLPSRLPSVQVWDAPPRPAPPRLCDPTSGLPAVRAPGPPRSSAAPLAAPAHSESHLSPVAAFSVRLALEAGPSATPAAVKFFSFLASAPGSCHPPCGFQVSGPGLEAPGTSSPRPASWALR